MGKQADLETPDTWFPAGAARRRASDRRTARRQGFASPRQTTPRLASCAPFYNLVNCDGRLRREPDAKQFLRLTQDENQMPVDTHT